MDFEKAVGLLLGSFEARRIRYAAIGGFALGLLGAPRATLDLDFLVHRDDLAGLDELMRSLGYSRRFQSENVSQYASADPARYDKESADIAALARARGGKLDWARLEEYFALFKMQDRLKALRAMFPHA